MKKLFTVSLALLTGVCLTAAQDLVSLDEWIKGQGLTPVIDGGAGGQQYHWDYRPAKAFDGVTYSTSASSRWLGNITKGCYLRYAFPESLTALFEVTRYRLHSLSASTYMKERAPRSWALYAHKDSSAAASDDGWVLLDQQTDVQWPFETGAYDSSNPATQFVLEFPVPNPDTYRAYKFVPLSSNLTSAQSEFNTGLTELVFLGGVPADGYVTVQGAPDALGEVSPGYGMLTGLSAGTNITFTASEYAYTDTIRYKCAGYVLETVDGDGNWIVDSTNLNATAYTYTGDGNGRRLTWLWEEDAYKLATGSEFGGAETVSVSPAPEADGYYAPGTEVTLTPVVPDGTASFFKNWYGVSVPEDAATVIPLTLTMDAPKTAYAHFRRTWSIVPDTTYQITDGNWTLRLNTYDYPSSILGIDATYQAPVAGSGILDLTEVEADTGLRLTSVNYNAFQGYADIVDVYLPDSVTFINVSAFQDCSQLRSVFLPAAITNINNSAFRDCTALQSVTPFLPETLIRIGPNAFHNCSSLTGDLVLSNPSLTDIWNVTFGRTAVTSVNLSGSGVTRIGEYAFSTCTSLTNAVLGAALKTIEGYAFNECSSLQKVELSSQVEKILSYAFNSCRALQSVTPFLPDTLTALEVHAFDSCISLTGDLKLNAPALTAIGSSAFASCRALTSVDMSGSSITALNAYCFYGNSSLTNAVFPEVLQTIGNYAFSWNAKLETVTPFLPETIISIGEYAFTGCTGLTVDLEITNPEFTSIGAYAFQSAGLTKITLPDAAVTINDYAFQYVPISTPIYFLGMAPAYIGTAALSYDSSRRILYVSRRTDLTGWADYISPLIESDLTSPSYPGSAAFGVLNPAISTARHWLVHWNPPLSDTPIMLFMR